MKRQTLKFGQALAAAVTAILLAGCAGPPTGGAVNKPPAVLSVEPWEYTSRTARTIRSPHYAIHTTISDDNFLNTLAEVMEAALVQYQLFTPGVKLSLDAMDCYVFRYRPEWADFTADKTGEDAALYLRINRGGYTIRDWYVAYFIGDTGTYAVAAHEGWHQYVARHLKSRMPPFLEEGIATMFENVRTDSMPPRFDLSPQSHRVQKLRRAIESKNTWPLERLITMHAGDVVALEPGKIEAFYAQNWAFAEFLWNAEDGRYRSSLQRMLSDCASGALYGSRRGEGWYPEGVRPMLEYYLGMDLSQIDAAYQAYCRAIVARARPMNAYPD